MRNHWAEEFVRHTERQGIPCQRVRHSNGCLDTAIIAGCHRFTKSMSYNEEKRLYFQGVDPGKLSEKGDAVALCGGRKGQLADAFVIPWHKCFGALTKCEPLNTYREREYLQYKFHIREREGKMDSLFRGRQSTDP